MKICIICQTPHNNRLVCSNACHIEQLRRLRLDPIRAAEINARISFNVRRSHAEPDVKARMSEAQRRRWAGA